MADYATIYWESGILDESWLRSQPGVESVEVSGTPSPVQFRIKFLDRQLTLNVMPPEEVAAHIAGFERYVRNLEVERSNSETDAIVGKLRKIEIVLGCVVDPSFDEEGYVGGLLTSISTEKDGLMFALDSILDSAGEPVIGPLANSERPGR